MNWRNVKLGAVCEVIAGQSPPSSTYNTKGEGLPFFQGKADFGEIHPNIRTWCSVPNKIAKPLDILLSVRAPVGPTNICNVQSCIGRGLAAIRPNGKTDPKFVYYYFQFIEPILSTKGNGSTFSAITIGDVKDLNFPLPPLPIQQKIAAILDQADALRKKDRELMAKYDELLQAVFYDMFGDPVRNERGWETKCLVNCVEMKGGGTPNTSNPNYFDGNIPWVSPKDMKSRFISTSIDKITEKAIKESSTKLIEVNSVLIVVRSGILKKTLPIAITVVPVAINQDMKALKCKPLLSPIFLMFQLEALSNQILQSVRGTTADNISSDVLKNIVLITPPKKLQNKFESQALNIQLQKNKMKSQVQNSEVLFQSLLQRAFKGELVN